MKKIVQIIVGIILGVGLTAGQDRDTSLVAHYKLDHHNYEEKNYFYKFLSISFYVILFCLFRLKNLFIVVYPTGMDIPKTLKKVIYEVI